MPFIFRLAVSYHCTKIVTFYQGQYSEVDSNGHGVFSRNDLESSFIEKDGKNWLVMSKVLGETGCTEIDVDGVTVCTNVSETITVRCLYSLEDKVVADNFKVFGQDQDCGKIFFQLKLGFSGYFGKSYSKIFSKAKNKSCKKCPYLK